MVKKSTYISNRFNKTVHISEVIQKMKTEGLYPDASSLTAKVHAKLNTV